MSAFHTLEIREPAVRVPQDIVVVGASAGGVAALKALVGGLPPDLQAAVFVVLHIPPRSNSFLPDILNAAGPLFAAHPLHSEAVQQGRVYVAPPGHQLLVERGSVSALPGSKESRYRPSVDFLFCSAAYAYGPRVVGVVLTGCRNDGTAGLIAVKSCGGIAVVEDPAAACYPEMPRSALEKATVDYCLPVSQIGALLTRLARSCVPPEFLTHS